GEAGLEARAAQLHRGGGVRAPLPAAPGLQPLRLAGDAAVRYAAPRAHRHRADLGGDPRGMRRLGVLELEPRARHRPGGPAARPADRRAQPRVRQDHALASLVRGGGSTMRDSVAFYNAAIRGFPQVTDFA